MTRVHWFRFWSQVDLMENGCWEWVGAKKFGYGYGEFGGRWRVHRLAWTWLRGVIPAGLALDHLCRNRACVNPEHLEPVTLKENVLRGVGTSAQKARQQMCGSGLHPLSGHNLRQRADGRRECRACKAARGKGGRVIAPPADEAESRQG